VPIGSLENVHFQLVLFYANLLMVIESD